MQLRKVFWAIAILMALSLSFTTAQEKAKAPRRGPLPAMYGKLGVSDDQRERMYDVQATYDEKIAPLREQIKTLIVERDEKLEEMLTPGQKLRLEELKAEARREAASKSESLKKSADTDAK